MQALQWVTKRLWTLVLTSVKWDPCCLFCRVNSANSQEFSAGVRHATSFSEWPPSSVLVEVLMLLKQTPKCLAMCFYLHSPFTGVPGDVINNRSKVIGVFSGLKKMRAKLAHTSPKPLCSKYYKRKTLTIEESKHSVDWRCDWQLIT